MIQRQRLALVEDGQVVMGMAGHADHVGHRQSGATTGESFTGRGLEVFERGGHDNYRGQSYALHSQVAVNQDRAAGTT